MRISPPEPLTLREQSGEADTPFICLADGDPATAWSMAASNNAAAPAALKGHRNASTGI